MIKDILRLKYSGGLSHECRARWRPDRQDRQDRGSLLFSTMIKPANKIHLHTMSKKSFQSLFAQKSWANNELFNALAPVAAEQGAESVHMAIRMLNHIYVVDRIFQAHLRGEPHGYAATNTEATPDLGELQFAVAELDAWFEGYAGTVTAHQLDEPISFHFTDGDAGTMSREEMLFHVITHGSYHRGNVGQMMKAISVAPPRDLYTKFLHVREPSRRQV